MAVTKEDLAQISEYIRSQFSEWLHSESFTSPPNMNGRGLFPES